MVILSKQTCKVEEKKERKKPQKTGKNKYPKKLKVNVIEVNKKDNSKNQN